MKITFERDFSVSEIQVLLYQFYNIYFSETVPRMLLISDTIMPSDC